MGNPVLDRLYAQRDKHLDFVSSTIELADSQDRNLTDSEQANMVAARESVEAIAPQIKELEQFEQLRAATEQTSRRYGSGDQERHSVAHTKPRAQYRTAGEVIVDRFRAFDGDQRAEDRIRDAGLTTETRALVHQTTADTPGLLPEPVVGAIVNDIDESRPLITSLGPIALGNIPGKTFSRPVVTQHTQAGEQAEEKGELVSRQLKVDGIDFVKRTFGGALNVSRQDIDWTAPGVWDALLRDLQGQYGLFTEQTVAAGFATFAGGGPVPVESDDLKGWATAMYAAAAEVYAGSAALPDTIWCSVDVWAKLGPVVDQARLVFSDGSSSGSLGNFGGNLFTLPRIVVPSLPANTLVIGRKNRYEVYEDRIGLLSAIEPDVLGVKIAYGGYVAFGGLNGAAFAKIAPPTGI